MDHQPGYEITPIGQAFLAANGPTGGCAAWVGGRKRDAWADARAREIHARIVASVEERKATSPLPA